MSNETEPSRPAITDPRADRAAHDPAPARATPAQPATLGPAEWVTLAELVRPQGRKGELLAEILTDFPERFAERRRLFLQSASNGRSEAPREVTLEQHWLHGGRIVLKFAGVDSIEQAEALRGSQVVIPKADRAPLEEGAVYIADLDGCAFYDRTTNSLVGTVVDVDRASSSLALIVVQPPGKRSELLIPFANAYAPTIDLAARRMEMTLPEGLLTLDAPLNAAERAELATSALEEPDGAAEGARPRTARRRKRA